jgi:AMP phosphorylase
MKLKVKKINLSSGGPLIAILNEKTAKNLNIYPTDRLSLRKIKSKEEINCVVNISDKGLKQNQIALFEEVLDKLNIKEGTNIEVKKAKKPKSILYIKKKLNGWELNKEEIYTLVEDLMHNELSDVELTYFVSGCYSMNLTLQETIHLTNAIIDTGERLKFKDKIILDKHCIGGVAGNRTTMIVVPIIASLGYKMPKTSSRAITSAAGTADTMEVLAPVELTKSRILKVIKKTNACIAWGGTVNLAAADDKLIKIRHPLSIDPEGMLLASILAKKKAAGATHVLIDIPYGQDAKVETKSQAKNLKKSFEKIAKHIDLKTKVLLTDGSEPIGYGIGPALEASDVISVLTGDGPSDLREKSILLATELLKLIKVKNAKAQVINALDTGLAYKKFVEIIRTQGGTKTLRIPKAKYHEHIKATRNGKIKDIKNKPFANLARLAGAPEDKAAGIFLRVKKGIKVKKGTELFTIYSNSLQNIDAAKKQLKETLPIIY